MILYIVSLRYAIPQTDYDEAHYIQDKDVANKKFDELLADEPRESGSLTLSTITFKDGVGVNVLAKDGGIFRWAESSDGEEWDSGTHEEEEDS
jgi:hypothetical protein